MLWDWISKRRARKRKNNGEQQGRRSKLIKIFRGRASGRSESTRTPGCSTPRVAAPIIGKGPRPEKKFESRRKTRAPGQEQKERGEIRSDVKAGRRDGKDEREGKKVERKRKGRKGRPLSPHCLLARRFYPFTPPSSPFVRRVPGGIFKFCHVQV